jgi:CRISPR-associated protein Csm3
MADNKGTTGAEFVGNLIIRGKFRCLTGLHIGGSKEKLEIGGVDSPVVRDPRTRYPYVPGSSLKGKLRSLLEYALGTVPSDGEVSKDQNVVRLFGIGVDEKDPNSKNFVHELENIGPSRLIVRDCHPTDATKKWWKTLDTDLLYTEYKSENAINRITSAANPRFIERVAAGSEFEFEMIYTQYDLKSGADHNSDAATDLANLRMAILLLEHNFLGKSGSRGYGRVEFRFEDPVFLGIEDYKSGDNMAKATAATRDFDKLKPIGDIAWAITNSVNA